MSPWQTLQWLLYLFLFWSHVTATHFKFGHPWVHLCVPNLQNESQILDGMTVYQGRSCSNSCWVKCPNVMAVVETVVRGINDKGKLKLIRWSLLITVAPLFIIITIITPPVNTTTLPKVAHMRLDSLTSCSFVGFFTEALFSITFSSYKDPPINPKLTSTGNKVTKTLQSPIAGIFRTNERF